MPGSTSTKPVSRFARRGMWSILWKQRSGLCGIRTISGMRFCWLPTLPMMPTAWRRRRGRSPAPCMGCRACRRSGWPRLPGRGTFVNWQAGCLNSRLRGMKWTSCYLAVSDSTFDQVMALNASTAARQNSRSRSRLSMVMASGFWSLIISSFSRSARGVIFSVCLSI